MWASVILHILETYTKKRGEKHKRTNDKLQLAQMFPNKQSLQRFLQ